MYPCTAEFQIKIFSRKFRCLSSISTLLLKCLKAAPSVSHRQFTDAVFPYPAPAFQHPDKHIILVFPGILSEETFYSEQFAVFRNKKNICFSSVQFFYYSNCRMWGFGEGRRGGAEISVLWKPWLLCCIKISS